MRGGRGSVVVAASILMIANCSSGTNSAGSTKTSSTPAAVAFSREADLPGGGKVVVGSDALLGGASIVVSTSGGPDPLAALPDMVPVGEAADITIDGGQLQG